MEAWIGACLIKSERVVPIEVSNADGGCSPQTGGTVHVHALAPAEGLVEHPHSDGERLAQAMTIEIHCLHQPRHKPSKQIVHRVPCYISFKRQGF